MQWTQSDGGVICLQICNHKLSSQCLLQQRTFSQAYILLPWQLMRQLSQLLCNSCL